MQYAFIVFSTSDIHLLINRLKDPRFHINKLPPLDCSYRFQITTAIGLYGESNCLLSLSTHLFNVTAHQHAQWIPRSLLSQASKGHNSLTPERSLCHIDVPCIKRKLLPSSRPIMGRQLKQKNGWTLTCSHIWYCIVLHIYIALLAVHTNQKRFQCKGPWQKSAVMRERIEVLGSPII